MAHANAMAFDIKCTKGTLPKLMDDTNTPVEAREVKETATRPVQDTHEQTQAQAHAPTQARAQT